MTDNRPSLATHVEAMLDHLKDDANFWRYLAATHDSQAIEGDLAMDTFVAAKLLREAAIKLRNPLRNENLATIISALNAALDRRGVSRADRRLP